MRILQEESELEEIVRLVGIDALSERERLLLETARSIQEDFLHQNSFHEVDTYASLEKQFRMMKLIMLFHQEALRAIERGADFQALITLPVREQIARSRYLAEDDLAAMDQIEAAIREQIADLSGDDLEQAYA